MSLVQTLILAIVQGLTEFLPISSSAHLALIPRLFRWPDPGLSFDIALHFGTLISILLYFWRDWVQVISQAFGVQMGSDDQLKRNPSLLWMLAVAALPIGVFGLAFNEQAETTWRNPFIIAVMMIVVAAFMWLAENAGRRTRDMSQITFFDSIVVGFAQALAIVPGTSRSGVTIAAGLFRNLDRETAARFSFLLATPTIAAAAAKAFHDLHKAGGLPPELRTQFFIGMIISAVVGCGMIALFLNFLRHHSLNFFIYYRIIFGIIVIALAYFFPQQAG